MDIRFMCHEDFFGDAGTFLSQHDIIHFRRRSHQRKHGAPLWMPSRFSHWDSFRRSPRNFHNSGYPEASSNPDLARLRYLSSTEKPRGLIRCRTEFVTAQVRAILPAFWGISGSNKTMCIKNHSFLLQISIAYPFAKNNSRFSAEICRTPCILVYFLLT